jgi:hypothetical protein
MTKKATSTKGLTDSSGNRCDRPCSSVQRVPLGWMKQCVAGGLLVAPVVFFWSPILCFGAFHLTADFLSSSFDSRRIVLCRANMLKCQEVFIRKK